MDYYEVDRLSNSMIKLLNKSYAHYLGHKQQKTTQAMKVGNAFHAYILEPERFEKEYIVKPPDMNFTKKDGIAWRDEKLNNGLTIITNDEYEFFKSSKQNLENHRLYPLLQGETEIEKEVYFDYRGIECKGKYDLINHSNNIIFDLKSIANCSKAETVARFDYSSQGAFYELSSEKTFGKHYTFVLIFCEKEFPNGIKFITLSPETLEYGMKQIDSGIDKYLYLQENPDCFTGYSDSFIYA